jgi:hypothetical protein
MSEDPVPYSKWDAQWQRAAEQANIDRATEFILSCLIEDDQAEYRRLPVDVRARQASVLRTVAVDWARRAMMSHGG